MYSINSVVGSLSGDLVNSENEAMDTVVIEREQQEEYIIELRDNILWTIKELVWKLGYTQGTAYGAHDGHDLVIKEQITEQKNKFDVEVV